MHIHEYQDASYIAGLASCLRIHPQSFGQWFLLYGQFRDVNHETWESQRGIKLMEMRRYFDGVPVDVFFTRGTGIFLLSRDLTPQSLGNIAKLLDVDVEVLCELGEQVAKVLPLLEQHLDSEATLFPDLSLPSGAMHTASSLPLELPVITADMRAARSKPTVLIVEDDPIAQRMIRKLIQEVADMDILSATCAEDALRAYQEYAPDLVFMDIGLPTANGFDVLRRIACVDSRAYVVMLSAHHEFDYLYHALYEGAKGYVAKPFRREQLCHYLHDCFSQRHAA